MLIIYSLLEYVGWRDKLNVYLMDIKSVNIIGFKYYNFLINLQYCKNQIIFSVIVHTLEVQVNRGGRSF